MLKGYIEVVEDFFTGGNGFNQAVVYARGEKIKQANPAESRDFRELYEQVGKGIFNFEVAAVGGYILADYVQFDGA